MARKKDPPFKEVTLKQVEEALKEAEAHLSKESFSILQALAEKEAYLSRLLKEKNTTIRRIRRLFGLRSSEKTSVVLSSTDDAPFADAPSSSNDPKEEPTQVEAPTHIDSLTAPQENPSINAESNSESKTDSETAGTEETSQEQKAKGHGRIPASAYTQAEHIQVPHTELHSGDRCPSCASGNLNLKKDPASIIHIVGNAPLSATSYDCEQLRCNTCGHIFTAYPEEVQGGKYDESAASMIANLHYGIGVPLYRLEGLQRTLETPVPSSTMWDILNTHADYVLPIYDELVKCAAQGTVLHNDDSTVRILEFMGKRRAALVAQGKLESPDRTGLFTTAIVGITDVGPIAVFYSGRKHAGENLDHVLDFRLKELPVPMAMSDALNRNVPKNHRVMECNCLSHARRYIVDEVDNYPQECRFILKKLAIVFTNDAEFIQLGASDDLRMLAHRFYSGPIMDELKTFMTTLLEEKTIEPNCSLGQAFNYFLKRWDKLTLFLRQPGAPLDNNITERTLKTPIKLRKTSMFYRSQRGAQVGDILMTIIYNAELHGINAYEYLTVLFENIRAVADNPEDWLPWTYQATLARLHMQKAA